MLFKADDGVGDVRAGTRSASSSLAAMFGVAAPRESDVAVAGRDQGVRSSSDLPLEGDVVRGFCQTRWAALHSGEQVIAYRRNGVSEAVAQAALNEVHQSLTTSSFSKVMLMQPVGLIPAAMCCVGI